MRRFIGVNLFCLLLVLAHNAFALPENAKEVFIVTPSGERIDLASEPFNKLESQWTKVTRIDPNSKTEHVYEGYFLKDFLKFFKEQFNLKRVDHMVTEAKDGYKVIFDKKAIEDKDAFIALNVQGVPEKGLFNQFLKSHFNWQPAYIIATGEKDIVFSPYQVKSIIVSERRLANPKMVKVAAPLQKGAEVFVKTCSKCHRYKGFGGKKAPNMKFMMRRWRLKSDEQLKKFLRSPQDVLNRKIQMSAFNGTDAQLDSLVKFLRSVK